MPSMEDNLNNITYFTVLNIIQMLHNSKSNYVVEWDKDLKIPRTVEISGLYFNFSLMPRSLSSFSTFTTWIMFFFFCQ